MGLRAAVAGLVKHQVYLENPTHGVAVTTFWTYKAGAVTEARRTQEQGAIRTWLNTNWKPITKNLWSATAIKSWDFSTNPPTKLTSEIIVPVITGSDGTVATVPPSVVAVVALRTQPVGSAIRDRNNGRIAHSGLIAINENGTLASPSAATVLAAYNPLLTALKTATQADRGNWSVVSFKADHAYRVVPVVTAVNHLLVRPTAGTQRRRNAHAGPYARGA